MVTTSVSLRMARRAQGRPSPWWATRRSPGSCRRSFQAMFDIIRENSTKFDYKVTDRISLGGKILEKLTSSVTLCPCLLLLLHVLPCTLGFGLYARAVQRQAAGPLCEPGWWGPCTAPVPGPGQGGWKSRGTEKGGCVRPRSRDKERLPVPRSSMLCSRQACANRHISATSEFSVPCHAA